MEKIDYPTTGLGQVGVVIWKKKIDKVGSLPNNLYQCVFQMCVCVCAYVYVCIFPTLVMNLYSYYFPLYYIFFTLFILFYF